MSNLTEPAPVRGAARAVFSQPAVDLGAARGAATTAAGASTMPLAARVRSGANWFYWIAALSVVNSVIVLAGGKLHFVVGLGITEIVDVVARQAGGAAVFAAVVIDVFIAAAFALLGMFANRRSRAAFVAGMMLYTADGALLLLMQDWLSAAFHGFALFCMYKGFAAAQEMRSEPA